MFWSEFRQLLKDTDVRCYFTEGVTQPDDDAWVTVTTELEDGFWERMEDDYTKGQTITVHLRRDEAWVPIGSIPLDRDAVRRWNDWHIGKVRRVVVSEAVSNAMAVDWIGNTPELKAWISAAMANYFADLGCNPSGAIRVTSLGLTDNDKKIHLDGSSWEPLFSEDLESLKELVKRTVWAVEKPSAAEEPSDG